MDDEKWTIERHLAGKPDLVRDLYRRFIETVESCSPFAYTVTKTGISLKGTRRGFAGAKPKTHTLDGFLDLQRVVRDTRIVRSSPYTKRLYVHQFRINSATQLDAQFARWVREACDVGAGARLATWEPQQQPPVHGNGTLSGRG